MRLVTTSLVLFSCFADAATAAPRHQSKRPIIRKVVPVFNPATYANSVSDLDCTNVLNKISSLVPVEKVFRTIAKKYAYGLPPKDGFETTQAYQQRSFDLIASEFGGTNKMVSVLPLEEHIKYDADRQIMTVYVFSNIGVGSGSIKAYSGIDVTGNYAGINAYGATANVERNKFTQFFLNVLFESDISRRPLYISLSTDRAQSLKNNGSLVVVGRLAYPMLDYERSHSSATISDPQDTTFLKYNLTVKPLCIIVANGTEVVGRMGN